jgi:hypothetical protein
MSQPLYPYARTYSVKGVGIATVVLLAAAAASSIAMALSPLAARALARRALANDDVDLLNQAQLIESPFALAYLGAFIVTAVLVIIWLYRARKNLDAFPEASPSMGAGWAIGGWFIPFANLVIPGRVMASVVRDSLPGGRVGLVWTWWITWIVGNGLEGALTASDQAEFNSLPSEISGPEDYQDYIDYFGNELGRNAPSMLLNVLAGILLAVLIIRVSRAQDNRIAAAMPPPIMPGMVVAPPGYPGAPGYPAPPGYPASPTYPAPPGSPATPGYPAGPAPAAPPQAPPPQAPPPQAPAGPEHGPTGT